MLTYSRGEWNAVVTPLGAALFAEDMPVRALGDVWHGLGAEPGPGAVIGGLIGSFGSSLGVLPSFAAAFYDVAAGEVRLMVRGAARARVTDASGVEQEVSGLGVSTWTERAIANPARIELLGAGDDDVVLPLRDGVVAAGRLTWVITEAGSDSRSLSDRSESTRDEVPVATERFVSVAALPRSTRGGVEAGLPATDDEEAEPRALSERSETRSGEVPGVEEPAADETVAPALEFTHAEPEIEATTGYDDLVFGETRLGTVEDAAVREAAAQIEVVDPLALPEPGPELAPVSAPAPQPPQPARTTLITGIPGGAASAPLPAPAAPALPAAVTRPGDHDGETVSAEQVAALAAQLAASEPTIPSFSAAAAVVAPTLVVSTGERVALDRSAVVGRRPRAVRATGAIPHLVTVPSPNQDISRNHVELRVEGSDVVATDLGTTNGTWLLRTGVEPVRLQPSDAALLVAGDRLDLGEDVVLSFEGL